MEKKWIALLLVFALSMTACTAEITYVDTVDLMESVYAKPVSEKVDLNQNDAAVTDFGVRLLKNSFNETQNTLISPLSVLYALSMTANGACGETLAQMEEVMGLNVEVLNEYLHAYMAQLPQSENGKLSLANAIWFKDDPQLTVKESFLQTNADYYGAGAFKVPFDETTCNAINRWVKENTGGMIEEILNEIPADAVMYLVNALAFEAQWKSVYEEYQISDGTFTTESGENREVELMYSTEHLYLEDDLATGVIKYYENADYAFAALLPNEGVTVEEYLSGLTGEHLLQLQSEPQDITTYTWIPKFETGYALEMSEFLMNMGITDAFDWTVADFSNMGSYQDKYLVIDRVLHKTRICVDDQGTKAGAATAVEVAAEGAALPPEDSRTVKLDRPFVYMLIDCKTNIPFFIGTMMDVEQTEVAGDPVGVRDHTHSLASEPTLVEEPVSGYCGNTVTTVYVGEEEYSFMGSDSVALTDLLINLQYDPLKVCKCLPEYTVDTEFGEQYGISLSGYARCDEGQANLTEEQLSLVKEILGRLGNQTP